MQRKNKNKVLTLHKIVTVMHKNSNNNALEYRQELKTRILETAMPMFKKHGPKVVRMDDIANALSISKRTLYEIYANKEELLLACVKRDSDNLMERLHSYARTAENELDIVVTFFRLKFDDLDSVTPLFLSELDKYQSVKDFFCQRHDEQQQNSAAFMRQCIENGFFVPDINYDIIQDLCDKIMETRILDQLYDKYSLRDIFRNYFIVLLRGFCTEKGIMLLDQYLKKSPI